MKHGIPFFILDRVKVSDASINSIKDQKPNNHKDVDDSIKYLEKRGLIERVGRDNIKTTRKGIQALDRYADINEYKKRNYRNNIVIALTGVTLLVSTLTLFRDCERNQPTTDDSLSSPDNLIHEQMNDTNNTPKEDSSIQVIDSVKNISS